MCAQISAISQKQHAVNPMTLPVHSVHYSHCHNSTPSFTRGVGSLLLFMWAHWFSNQLQQPLCAYRSARTQCFISEIVEFRPPSLFLCPYTRSRVKGHFPAIVHVYVASFRETHTQIRVEERARGGRMCVDSGHT